MLVNIGHKEPVLVLVGKRIREVNPGSAMGRAVAMIGDGSDVAVDIGIEVPASLAVVDPARYHVPEVRNNAGGDKELPLGIVVDTPGIAKAVGDDLEAVLEGMIAPDSTVDVDRLTIELDIAREGLLVPVDLALAGRLADPRGRGKTLAAVEPAIGPPVKAVEGFVPVADSPAGQADLDILDIGLVIAVAVGNVEQVRRRAEPETIKTYRYRRREGDALEEDLTGIEHPIFVGVLQDQDAAVARVREPASPGLVVTILRDPHPPPRIPAEGHGLGDHRLGGKDIHLEAFLDRHLLESVKGRKAYGIPTLSLRKPPEH